MNKRLDELREMTLARAFGKYRTGPDRVAGRWAFRGSEQRQATELFKLRCREEIPIVLPDERIVFMRSRKGLAWCRSDVSPFAGFLRRVRTLPLRAMRKILRLKTSAGGKSIHRMIENTTVDYPTLLAEGLSGRIQTAEDSLKRVTDARQREFLQCAVESMEALCELADRYAAEARRVGNEEMARILAKVPRERPTTLHEALQTMRIVQYGLYLHGMWHCGLGRVDQYLLPFYESDVREGRLTRERAKELMEEFFIALNRDADLYPGMQQGDNGQSLMLGGCDPKTGASAVNDLTYLVIEAALETRLIDPKVNLRVDGNTPLDLLELCSELTKCGLGFPQYSNDEVVIPALVRKGYDLEDARDYSVAACWEFVIPGKAMDFVNVGAVSFPHAVDKALRDEVDAGGFSETSFRRRIVENIRNQLKRLVDRKEVRHPAPFLSAFFAGTLESGRDITECAKYRNLGIHGAGASNAADQISGVMKVADEQGPRGLERLVKAENRDFRDDGELRRFLTEDCPKVGNADPAADGELRFLFDAFADAAEELGRHGRQIRPGSGSAMYYIWLTDTTSPRVRRMLEPVVGATSDGRRLNAPLASSLAPAHEARVGGILSVLKSFAGIDYSRIMNGGPITIEFSHMVFKTPDGVRKLAQLIRYFVRLGCQQLQLNVLDVEELEDALAHPERHRNLVVRVWGWSGYFCELDREFQMQIIRRHRYGA